MAEILYWGKLWFGLGSIPDRDHEPRARVLSESRTRQFSGSRSRVTNTAVFRFTITVFSGHDPPSADPGSGDFDPAGSPSANYLLAAKIHPLVLGISVMVADLRN